MKVVTTLRVGLTGGIASGKTTVANLFAARGITVIDTDEIAREVMQPGQPALEQVVQAFGAVILDVDGGLDRRRMREIVFRDPAQRRRLESILHPLILTEMTRRSARAGGPYQIVVIPLLVEGALTDYVDRVLVVDCSPEIQLQRLRTRDAESLEQARAMIAAQATREKRLAAGDDVVVNDGTLTELESQVEQLHRRYLQLAQEA